MKPAVKLKQIRQSNGLTQKQLAEILGTDEFWISNIETGRSKPSDEFMLKAEMVGLPVSETEAAMAAAIRRYYETLSGVREFNRKKELRKGA